MKSIFAPVAAAALLLAGNALAQLTINTPGPAVVCQPLLITWSGGTPPYFLSLLPGNQPNAAPIIDFGQQTGTSFRWVVNITAGTSLGLDLRDNTGIVAQTAPFNTQPGTDTSCLTGSTGSSITGSTSAEGPTTSPATTPPATTPPATTPPATTPTAPITTAPGTSPATTSTASTTSTTTNSAASTTTSSSATGNMANAGLAGAFGIGAALVALIF